MSRPTDNAKAAKIAQDLQEQQAKRFREDVIWLLAQPRFRRYMARLVYGELRLKGGGAWKRDSEIHKEAARRDVGASILRELADTDPRGFILLEREHVERMAEELDLPSTQEHDDADEA